MLVNVGLIRGSRRSGLLVKPGFLSSSVTYTRTGIATGTTTSNNLYEVAANFPRFNANNELIWEGQRTNTITNPRAEGATGATQPPGWICAPPPGTSASYTRETRFGIPGVRIAITGVTNAAGGLYIYPGQLTVGVDVPVTVSAYAVVDVDDVAITGLLILQSEYSGAVYVGGGSLSWWSTRLTLSRRVFSRTTTEVTTTRVQQEIVSNSVASGVTLNFALWIACPQFEQASFASSIILPPIGTPGTSTRGPDTGVFNTTPTGSIVFAMRPGQAAPASTNQVYVTVNAGSDANRWEFGCQPAGNNLLLTRVVGGTGNNTASVGTQVPGGMVVGVLTWDSAGNGAAKVQGGTYRLSTSGPTGIISGRLGNRVSGAAALFGTIAYAQLIPGRYLTEAEMDSEIAKLSGYT